MAKARRYVARVPKVYVNPGVYRVIEKLKEEIRENVKAAPGGMVVQQRACIGILGMLSDRLKVAHKESKKAWSRRRGRWSAMQRLPARLAKIEAQLRVLAKQVKKK